MKNIISNRRREIFYPCGLEIPQDQIFASARNLALSLMSALTGTPTEYLLINKAEISIGLGCFSLIGLNGPDHIEGDEENDIEFIDEDYEDSADWGLSSIIRYKLLGNSIGNIISDRRKAVASFDIMALNISPDGLLDKSNDDLSAVQFFGPYRLLKKLRSNSLRLDGPLTHCRLVELENYLEDGFEPNDAILTPPEEEFELYWDADDPQEKFRILLNMITTFASTLSAKLMECGHVAPSSIHIPSVEAMREIDDWFSDGKIAPKWKPTMEQVKKAMKARNLKKRDIHPEVRKLLWPRK